MRGRKLFAISLGAKADITKNIKLLIFFILLFFEKGHQILPGLTEGIEFTRVYFSQSPTAENKFTGDMNFFQLKYNKEVHIFW